ncbi:exonuclease [Gordonia phage Syleon]|uniref:Cas4 family exonuclease n=3 Tax=Octobienvirus TaxID=3044779 RepID=A0AAE9C2W5_9CAUD|nr:exonuclease [Gordonia Phage Sephiroth]YP_010246577.1 exonuclease [Gordonia phage Kudefre]YP_010246718.1 exonuclease [Gordonia phage Syleon]QGH75788.1 Cas4 family exonuclease [Gordonia phage Syleon]QNN99399.1 exonuclease [Gordonia Phage Sephiroth]UDL15288.1 Cas4 family exonuclease [Gordonia phage Kudefre]
MPPGPNGEPQTLTGEWREGRKGPKKAKWWYSPDATAYSRMSSIAKALDTKENLVDWAACQAAVGVMLDPAARSEVVTLINEYDADPWNNGDDESPKNGKARLKEAVEQARATAGSHVASAKGTEFHKLGELHNQGKSPRIVQDHLKPLFEHYKEAVAPLEFIQQELFVANDELQKAGSVDYMIRMPKGLVVKVPWVKGPIDLSDRVLIGDLKTGKWDAMYPMSVTTQIAGYATAKKYDQETGVREDLHPDLYDGLGLLVHFPIGRPDARVKFYLLDTRLGLRAAKVAQDIEELRKEFKRTGAKPKEVVFK